MARGDNDHPNNGECGGGHGNSTGSGNNGNNGSIGNDNIEDGNYNSDDGGGTYTTIN
jgi:hypothetical protein